MTLDDVVQALQVHQFQPGDRLLVRVPEDTVPEALEVTLKDVVAWSGLPREHILVAVGAITLEVTRGLPT